MTKYIILLLLISCSKEKDKSSFSMDDFVNQCSELGKAVKANRASSNAWYKEELDEYVPDCALEFIKSETEGYRELYFHHFDQKELNAIEYYKKNKHAN